MDKNLYKRSYKKFLKEKLLENSPYLECICKVNFEKKYKEGREEERVIIAKNLLDILDNTVIAKKTGLSEVEIEKLREQ